MSGWTKPYPGGFIDWPSEATPIYASVLNTLQSAIYDLKTQIVNPLDFGAVGDGATDDAAAIQAAATAASGKILFFPSATFKINSGITLPSDIYVLGSPGATLNGSGAGSSATLLSATGTLGTSVALTSNTTVNGTSLAFAAGSESNFAADDYVLIGSSAYFETRTQLYGAATGQRLGEIANVTSTSSGALTLRTPLAGGWTDSSSTAKLIYKTTDSAFVSKITPVSNVTIEGLKIVGATGSGAGSQVGINVQYGTTIRIRRVRFEHIGAQAIVLQSCVDYGIDGCSAFDIWSTGSGYMIAVGDASQDGWVRGCYGRNFRHLFTTTSSSGSYGVVRRANVADCTAFNTINSGDAFDTHAAAEGVYFESCVSYGSSEFGFNIECPEAELVNCRAYGAQKDGFGFFNESLAPTRFRTAACKAVNCGQDGSSPGLRYVPPATSGAEPEIWHADFDVLVVNPGGVGVNLSGTTTHHLKSVRLRAQVENPGSANGAVFTDYLDAPNLDVDIRRVPANTTGVKINHSTRPRLTGTVEYASVGTGAGALLASTTGGAVTGLVVVNGGKGVQLDAATTKVVVSGGDFDTCTTPISDSGAGNIYQTAAADKYNST